MIKRFKAWQFRRRQKIMERWLNDPGTGMGQLLMNRATEMAMTMITNWLDRKRIRHCMRCPSTESLYAVDGAYLCPGHKAQNDATETKKEKLAVA